MLKRGLLCLLAIVVVWVAADLVLHDFFLAPLYAQNPTLWRPMREMNVPLIHAVRFGLAALFVVIYALQIRPKGLRVGLLFGLLMGLLLGVAVGIGTYIHSPIAPALMWGWFAGAIVKSTLAGALLGGMLKESPTLPLPPG